MTAAELVPVDHRPPAFDPGSAEGVAWFDATMRQAEVLAKSSIVPAQYRGKPGDIVVAAMIGRDFGWSPTMAMTQVHVVEGKPTLSAQAMVALVRAAGHSLSGDSDAQGARLAGRRTDNGDTLEVEFTIWDAERAGLCTVDDQGRTRARSNGGKRLPWEMYPQAMCWARAVSQLCRMLFADVLMGVSYTPEELDGIPGEISPALHGSPLTGAGSGSPSAAGPAPHLRAMRDMLRDRLTRLNRNHTEAWDAWKTDQPDGWEFTPDGLQEALDMTADMLRSQGIDPFLEDVVDAEIVTDGDPTEESAGRAGDNAGNGKATSSPPGPDDRSGRVVESLPAPPVLTETGGGGTSDGAVRETEPSPPGSVGTEGAGSSSSVDPAPNPVAEARQRAKDDSQ